MPYGDYEVPSRLSPAQIAREATPALTQAVVVALQQAAARADGGVLVINQLTVNINVADGGGGGGHATISVQS